jgi:soluble lytic murein transglycosylase-like protein
MEVGIKIMFAVMIALFVAVLYLALIPQKGMEIREEHVMTPTYTPVPAATWTRYPLPLDDELQKHVERLCKEYEVDAAIIFAMIEAESGCDPNCVGDNGRSYGLMQIMEECHHERCVRLGADNLFNPYQNVLVGIDFFAELMNTGNGIDWALSWYNSGHGEPTAYALQIQNRAEELREASERVQDRNT